MKLIRQNSLFALVIFLIATVVQCLPVMCHSMQVEGEDASHSCCAGAQSSETAHSIPLSAPCSPCADSECCIFDCCLNSHPEGLAQTDIRHKYSPKPTALVPVLGNQSYSAAFSTQPIDLTPSPPPSAKKLYLLHQVVLR